MTFKGPMWSHIGASGLAFSIFPAVHRSEIYMIAIAAAHLVRCSIKYAEEPHVFSFSEIRALPRPTHVILPMVVADVGYASGSFC